MGVGPCPMEKTTAYSAYMAAASYIPISLPFQYQLTNIAKLY
jgi:hypothetical protein